MQSTNKCSLSKQSYLRLQYRLQISHSRRTMRQMFTSIKYFFSFSEPAIFTNSCPLLPKILFLTTPQLDSSLLAPKEHGGKGLGRQTLRTAPLFQPGA